LQPGRCVVVSVVRQQGEADDEQCEGEETHIAGRGRVRLVVNGPDAHPLQQGRHQPLQQAALGGVQAFEHDEAQNEGGCEEDRQAPQDADPAGHARQRRHELNEKVQAEDDEQEPALGREEIEDLRGGREERHEDHQAGDIFKAGARRVHQPIRRERARSCQRTEQGHPEHQGDDGRGNEADA
jgi:hypothetical protein